MQQVVAGLASGSIYASLALALVLIHRATGVINFAQGEMATFSTYIAWTLTTNHGWSYWPAFAVTLRALVRRRRGDPPGRDPAEREGLVLARRDRHDRTAAPHQRARDDDLVGRGARRARARSRRGRSRSAASRSRSRTSARSASSLATVVALWLLFQYTKIGLAMRAAAVNPAEARLVGVRVTWMLSLGWGLAAVLGAIAGMLAAPSVPLDPNLMQPLLHLRVRGGGARRDRLAGRRGRRRADARRRAQPARHVRRLRRRRPAAARRPARDPRRAARASRRGSSAERGEAGMRLRRAGCVPLVAFAVLAVVVVVLPAFVSGVPRAAARLRRDLPDRAHRAQRPHGLHRPDLARPRRVHGGRRVHDRDPDGRPRRQGRLDDPDRGARDGHRRLPLRVPRAAALRALPRARDVRDRRLDARR